MRQEAGQQHRKRFGQHLCNAIYKIQIGKEGGTRPSKQFEYCIYLHEKSFHHSGLPEWFSWSGWSDWSDGLGGPGGPGGPGWVLKGPKSAGFYRVKKVDTFQSNIKVSLTLLSVG